ncbi:L-type lectin-domain containing receptor kinase S.1, partial [Colletotrichum shisoi]
MASTSIVGMSGRQYVRGQLLHRDQRGRDTIFKATRGGDSAPVVFNHVSDSIYKLSQRLGTEFADCHWLRMPIDYNDDEYIVVYPYFKDTMLNLVRADPDFPEGALKKALRHVGEGLREFHAKGWLHLVPLVDVKPDNIFIDWTTSADGKKTITSAALGDFGISFKPEGNTPLRTAHPVGNFMWRSPEGQTGTGVTKASDVFSFGLLCIYALGGADFLLMENEQELAQLAAQGVRPEQAILTRHLTYFGPATQGLLRQVDKSWRDVLAGMSADAVAAVQEQPGLSFKVWGAVLGPAAVDMLSQMTNPDPTVRPSMNEVMSHLWWQEL